MKKALGSCIKIFSITIALSSLFSCSNSQETKLVYNDSDTIKQAVKSKEQNITWTQELESNILTQPVNSEPIQTAPDVVYSRELYKIPKNLQNPVYPSIDEFGSLDISNMRLAIKEKVEKFCKAFSSSEHKGAESSFSRKYLFNYVFFVQDFEKGWKKNFGKEIPEDAELFNKWIYGEPFNGSDIIQFPVRFYTDCGTIDVTVFLSAVGNNEFYQITIDRWQKV